MAGRALAGLPSSTLKTGPRQRLRSSLPTFSRDEVGPVMSSGYASAGEALLRTRLALSPDEAAIVLGVIRNVIFDLQRVGQLRSVKAVTRRLICPALCAPP